MANLTIRRLPDEVKATLVARAARRGRSLEAEARDILTSAATTPLATETQEPFGQWAYRITRPGFDDLHEILEQEKTARKAHGIAIPSFD